MAANFAIWIRPGVSCMAAARPEIPFTCYTESCMNDHKKKMVAPIVITVIMVLYYIIYFALIASFLEGVFRIFFGIIPAVFAVVMIYVCFQRINEIEGGEEDDIGKY